MNRFAIKNTAVLKREDGVFVYESPLFPGCIGAAETEKIAWAHFDHHVEDSYKEYAAGRLAGMYDSPGRPSKSLASFTVRVRPRTKKLISELAEEKQCSQGELVDYLLAYWEAGNSVKGKSQKKRLKKP